MFHAQQNNDAAYLASLGLCEDDLYDPLWDELKWSYNRQFDSSEPIVTAKKKSAMFDGRAWAYAQEIRDHFWKHINSPEFWLGMAFGAATRISTRIAIIAAFSSTPKMAVAAGFAACAIAGVAAGIVTHFVRTMFRNSKKSDRQEKEKYWNRTLLDVAIIGLFGGLLGGCVTNAGVVIVRASSFAVGASVGIAAGVFHAGIKSFMVSRTQDASAGWSKLVFQGAAFGAIGGVLGVISTDIFGVHSSVAAPTGVSGDVIYLHPSAGSNVLNPCGPYACGGTAPIAPAVIPQPPSAPLVVIQPPPVVAPHEVVSTIKAPPVHHVAHHVTHHHHHRVVPCVKEHVAVHHVAKARHLKHVIHTKTAPQVVEKYFIIREASPPPPQTPLVIINQSVLPQPVVSPPVPVQPLHIDPCATGNCEAPCDTISQLNVKGPCADPNMPCVERVSFNESGEATKVVLEPRAAHAASRYAEVVNHQVAAGTTNWGKGASGPEHDPGAYKVSVIMPFVNNAAAIPMPA